MALEGFLQSIRPQPVEVESIVSTSKSQKQTEKRLIELITSSVVTAANGEMRTCEYSQRSKSRQRIFCFVGTHWMQIPIQQYYDFCKAVVERIQIPTINSFDVEFMNRVFEQIAFSMSEYQSPYVPEGYVWINMQNGTLEIDITGADGIEMRLRPHRAQDFITYCLAYRYDPQAECPLFHRFLNQVLPEADAQQVLMEYIGYCFTDRLKLEKCAVFYGSGSNGKSVLLDVITHLLGSENVSNIGLSELTTDPEKRSLMENKLANISHESNKQLDTSVLKKVISGEPVDVRILYQGTHIMERYGKLLTSFNILPPSEYTYGYFRRWLLFPFNVTIPEGQQDIMLTQKLCQELSGILNWVLEALQRLLSTQCFTKSVLCQDALNDYKRTSNSALLFLSERCALDPEGRKKLIDIYQEYRLFCGEEGIRNAFGKSNFKKILCSWGATESTIHGFKMYNVMFLGN